MKLLLASLAVIVLPCCSALEGYTPMLSLGFEVGGSKINIGIAPIPVLKREPAELPAIIVPNVPSK
jgi:hypothetical protein